MTSATVCLIAKNEGRYLLEWMAYYLVLGFDRLLIYDNDSTDETRRIIDRARRNEPKIAYVPWPDVRGRAPQLAAYNEAVNRVETEWVAFLDADEFLVLKEHDTIGSFLSGFGPETSAVTINWRIFGSSDHKNYATDLVIRRFQRCSEPEFEVNRHVKTIARVKAIEYMYAHTAVLAFGEHRGASGQRVAIERRGLVEPISYVGAQINHYVVKSRQEYDAKVARGGGGYAPDNPIRRRKFTPQFWTAHDRNESADTSILRFAPAVEKEMSNLQRGRMARAVRHAFDRTFGWRSFLAES